MKSQGKTVGRPTSYTSEIGDRICLDLASGATLRSVVAAPGMPDQATVYRWLKAQDEFRKQYTLAREEQAHAVAEMAVDEAIAAKDAQLGRLAYDARKWFASKLAPKVYGDKLLQEHSGPDGIPLPLIVLPSNGREPS